ncbi:unnamed protein product, partial [Ixodes hexagonus]
PVSGPGPRNVNVTPLSPTTALVSWRAAWPDAQFNVTCFPRLKDASASVVFGVVGHDISDNYQKTALLTDLFPLKNYTIWIQSCLQNNNCGAPIETWVIAKTRSDLRSVILSLQPNRSPGLDVPVAPSMYLLGCNIDTAALRWIFYNTGSVLVQVSLNNSSWVNCTTQSDNCRIIGLQTSIKTHWSGITTLAKLLPGTSYRVSVRGCNKYGCGAGDSTDIST